MISSSHPAFAKLGPKLERVQREIDSLDDFLRRYDSLAPEMVSEWGRTTAVASAVANAYNGIETRARRARCSIFHFKPNTMWPV